MPAMKHHTKMTLTVRIEGMVGWDGTTQPPQGQLTVW